MSQKYPPDVKVGCISCIEETGDIILSQIGVRNAWTGDNRFYCEMHKPSGATRVPLTVDVIGH